MTDSPMSVSFMKLILIFCCFLSYTESRHVKKSGEFSGFVSLSSSDDLEVAAAEPRPVIIENIPEVLPLIADQNAFSDSTISLASEKVEKVLQRPLAFSYQSNDQSSADSEVKDTEEKPADIKEVDQKPAAIDYYKHSQNIESAESDRVTENVQDGQSEDIQNKKENEEVNTDSSDHESVKSDDDSSVEYNSSEESESGQYGVLEKHDGHKTSGENHSSGGGHSSVENIGNSSEGSHKKGGEHEIEEGSEAHGGGGHGPEANGSYQKGGGQEHHSGHRGEKGEKGEKGYKGHHYDEKGEKGYHAKEKHAKDYEEKGGEHKEHHHDDGYNAEHEQGEKGEKASKFEEYGEHSKGHSTKGEHNIHKKDEYQKKQEFYDESSEEDGFEKDGDYFHENDYSKGSVENGSFHKGAEEEAHHGKKHEHEKGGHYKEKTGYKDAKGHAVHHDHANKYGEKGSNSGGTEWSHSKGTGGGGEGGGLGGGAHQHHHADETNSPIRITKPDQISHSQNIVELNLDTKEQHTPDILYPPLTGSPQQFNDPTPSVQVSYEDDSPFMRILTPIQRRSDDINNGEDEKIEKTEEDNPKNSIEGVYNKEESRVLRGHKYDIKNPSEENAEYKDLLSPISQQSSDEIGVYSIYKLGDYTPPKPLTVASIENQQTQSLEEVLNPSNQDNTTAISEDTSKQIEAVSTSMKPIVVEEEGSYVI